MTTHLSAFHRKRRTNLLILCGSLLEKIGLVNDTDTGKNHLDEEVVCGFLCADKNNFFTKNECEFYRSLGKELREWKVID